MESGAPSLGLDCGDLNQSAGCEKFALPRHRVSVAEETNRRDAENAEDLALVTLNVPVELLINPRTLIWQDVGNLTYSPLCLCASALKKCFSSGVLIFRELRFA